MLEPRELTCGRSRLRILVAVVLGGILGIERERKNRAAGLRTYALVCIGACVVMITNQYVYQVFQTGDPVRMGAQVISGIGFLGAGTILVTAHSRIRGLTTAAGLWAAACIGLAIGIGLYEVALFGGVSIFLVLTVLHVCERHMVRNQRSIDVYMELEVGVSLGEFLALAREKGISLSNLQLEHDTGTPEHVVSFLVTVRGKRREELFLMLQMLRELEGVRCLETL